MPSDVPPNPPEGSSASGDRFAGKPSPGLFDLLAMGLASALMVGIGLAAGLGIDVWLHSEPIGVICGLVVGLAAAVASTVHQVRNYL